MSAITVSNLRIIPYTQKDLIDKLVFGDSWSITIKLPTPNQAGDVYKLGIDFENTLIPANRPLCAGTDQFILEDDELTFSVKLGTARLRDFVSRIKKPMPLAIQIIRIRNNKAETLLLDSILALPSVFDGVVTVCEGDPISDELAKKLDKPAIDGTAGQILSINEQGQNVWRDEQEIPEQVQTDWDESDSDSPAFLVNRPNLSQVATSGSYTDLSDKPDLTVYEKKEDLATVAESGNYADLSNKPDLSVYAQKSELATVATTGNYADLSNKPSIPTKTSDLNNDSDFQTGTEVSTAIGTAIANKADKATTLAGYGITDAYTKSEVDSKVASVFHYKGSVSTYADLPDTGLAVGDVYNVAQADSTHGIKAGDNVAWTGSAWDVLAGDVDLTAYATKAELSTVAFSGSYNDLSNKPEIPAAQVQCDYDESDSSDVAYIRNKPDINALIADALTIHNN